MFKKLDDRYVRTLLRPIVRFLCENLSKVREEYALKNLRYSYDDLIEIVDRVEKRKIYFHIFHNAMKMGELNEMALYCFWVLKLCPFSCVSMQGSAVNSLAATILFTVSVEKMAKKKNMSCTITKSSIQSLYYVFRYRDLSKESIMALAESYIS
ncbi:hypothetical protein FACS189427_10760 [Planctomycetales bacterium]|nr:hypothetical protein FACS189427_10760 [Planctomycetales bacterium]